MRTFDFLWLAAKNIKGRWALLPVLGIALSMICLCFGGAMTASVHEEKAQPYELILLPGEADISDSIIVQMADIEGVAAVSSLVEMPVAVEAGVSSVQLTLEGIDAAYLDTTFLKGGIFPESSVMPYIVLNEAALKQFALKNDETVSDTDIADKDWLNADIGLSAGEGARPVVSKISGIMADDDSEEAQVYMSLAAARQLLRQSGQAADYTGARVRVVDSGHAQDAAKAIAALGLSVVNTNETLQAQWDAKMKETTYLISAGIFCLLCAIVLIMAWRKISMLEQAEAFAALGWMGMKKKAIRGLFAVQAMMICMIGIGIGVVVSISIPSFLSQELHGTSIFSLAIPFWIVAVSAAVCLMAAAISMLNVRKKLSA